MGVSYICMEWMSVSQYLYGIDGSISISVWNEWQYLYICMAWLTVSLYLYGMHDISGREYLTSSRARVFDVDVRDAHLPEYRPEQAVKRLLQPDSIGTT